MFEIVYHEKVLSHDVSRLDKTVLESVYRAVSYKLVEKPEFYGIPLRADLKGYRKLRVGDYRIVFRIEGRQVKVFIIAHRKLVYTQARKRI